MNMKSLSDKFFKRDYWQMFFKDKLPFLRRGSATIRGHKMTYPHWPSFWGIFYEIFIDDNYRVDGLIDVRHIIDAGSNIGVSAVYFAQIYPEAHIDCFEPNQESIAYLRENVAAYPNVEVHPYALAATEGTMRFFVDADVAGSSIASSVNLMGSKQRSSKEVSVEARKLSDFITSPVDIFKMDIEGGEMGVMEDLVSSGKIKQIRTILMEFHYDPTTLPELPTRMLELLEENGFFYYIRRTAMITVPEPIMHGYIIFAFRKP
jgi:FkbM family methyltransferase